MDTLFCWYTGVEYRTSLGQPSPIPAETRIGSILELIILPVLFETRKRAITRFERDGRENCLKRGMSVVGVHTLDLSNATWIG